MGGEMTQFEALIGNPVFWALVFAYWIFSAIASSLPDPDAKSGNSYIFFVRFMRTLAGDVTGAFAKYVPGNVNKIT
jgi:hypothetical protein